MSKNDADAVEPKIFYLDEISEACEVWLRETRLTPWRRVHKICAALGDREIINDVEYIVDKDLSRRRLRRGEKPLWQSWDIPLLGYIPDENVIELDPGETIKASDLKSFSAPRRKIKYH